MLSAAHQPPRGCLLWAARHSPRRTPPRSPPQRADGMETGCLPSGLAVVEEPVLRLCPRLPIPEQPTISPQKSISFSEHQSGHSLHAGEKKWHLVCCFVWLQLMAATAHFSPPSRPETLRFNSSPPREESGRGREREQGGGSGVGFTWRQRPEDGLRCEGPEKFCRNTPFWGGSPSLPPPTTAGPVSVWKPLGW